MNLLSLIPGVNTLVETVFGNKKERDASEAAYRGKVYDQFASEFGHSKTWWDSLIDGLNRLPRPLMTFGTIYIFYMCWNDPEKFVLGTKALELMPKEGWYILGAVVVFWFGGKLPGDFGKYKSKKAPVQFVEQKSPKITNFDHYEDIEFEDRVKNRYGYSNLND